jgi:hypothetical protein
LLDRLSLQSCGWGSFFSFLLPLLGFEFVDGFSFYGITSKFFHVMSQILLLCVYKYHNFKNDHFIKTLSLWECHWSILQHDTNTIICETNWCVNIWLLSIQHLDFERKWKRIVRAIQPFLVVNTTKKKCGLVQHIFMINIKISNETFLGK